MMSRRKIYQRRVEQRSYEKLFIIVTEGNEYTYFKMNMFQHRTIKVKVFKGKHSAPRHLVQEMKKELKKYPLREVDEAWIVSDRNGWEKKELAKIYRWAKSQSNYYFAISNPKIEFWFLLHFESGKGIENSNHCTERFNRHWPDCEKANSPLVYEKKFKDKKENKVKNAIERARNLHASFDSADDNWPENHIGTTVYKLVEKLLEFSTSGEENIRNTSNNPTHLIKRSRKTSETETI